MEFSYGDNWLRSVGLLAKAQIASGDKAAARKTLESALDEVVLPTSSRVRTHTLVGKLRELLASLRT